MGRRKSVIGDGGRGGEVERWGEEGQATLWLVNLLQNKL